VSFHVFYALTVISSMFTSSYALGGGVCFGGREVVYVGRFFLYDQSEKRCDLPPTFVFDVSDVVCLCRCFDERFTEGHGIHVGTDQIRKQDDKTKRSIYSNCHIPPSANR
jgi:hypothetical protein